MIVDTVSISSSTSTVELQAWFDSHPNADVSKIVVSGSVFFIFYTEAA